MPRGPMARGRSPRVVTASARDPRNGPCSNRSRRPVVGSVPKAKPLTNTRSNHPLRMAGMPYHHSGNCTIRASACRSLSCSRVNELGRLHPAANTKTLTRQLRGLEEDGIIQRTVYREVPPRVEYSLTAAGRSLETIVDALDAWGTDFVATRGDRS